ncbi:CIA30 family protein [uncultured Roseicyclus sp.]|uniref:CIA30 family protein n=1 Tax=uncultured Roseicyclus sp. TaxID=543072 RepID=UPI002618E3B8|nr:CIA30 family protein [uncultured Roseicyclus sp.]
MITRRAVLAGVVAWAAPLRAEQEGFAMTPAGDLAWSYLADTVMGGVSQGGARMEAGILRLSGTVSTANRGGFIQARTEMPEGLAPATTALRLRVRGNGERYFIHLRSTRTRLPWQYYQHGFDTGPDWAEVTLPLADFAASGAMMAGRIRPEDIRSIGLVAYGRDHAADVSLAALGAV